MAVLKYQKYISSLNQIPALRYFRNCHIIVYLSCITLIHGKYRRDFGTVMPVKYKYDWNYIANALGKSKAFQMQKFTDRDLVAHILPIGQYHKYHSALYKISHNGPF